MTVEEYYTAPPQHVFDEIKAAAIKIWESYSDRRYVDDKVGRIKDLPNISDNAWYMVAMFDCVNQARLLREVSEETRDYVERALQPE